MQIVMEEKLRGKDRTKETIRKRYKVREWQREREIGRARDKDGERERWMVPSVGRC